MIISLPYIGQNALKDLLYNYGSNSKCDHRMGIMTAKNKAVIFRMINRGNGQAEPKRSAFFMAKQKQKGAHHSKTTQERSLSGRS